MISLLKKTDYLLISIPFSLCFSIIIYPPKPPWVPGAPAPSTKRTTVMMRTIICTVFGLRAAFSIVFIADANMVNLLLFSIGGVVLLWGFAVSNQASKRSQKDTIPDNLLANLITNL
jgi:hypothetical protein